MPHLKERTLSHMQRITSITLCSSFLHFENPVIKLAISGISILDLFNKWISNWRHSRKHFFWFEYFHDQVFDQIIFSILLGTQPFADAKDELDDLLLRSLCANNLYKKKYSYIDCKPAELNALLRSRLLRSPRRRGKMCW